MAPILNKLPKRKVTLFIGQYTQAWFLKSLKKATLTETKKTRKITTRVFCFAAPVIKQSNMAEEKSVVWKKSSAKIGEKNEENFVLKFYNGDSITAFVTRTGGELFTEASLFQVIAH